MDELIERTVNEVTRGQVFHLLPDETQAQIRALSEQEVIAGARRTFTRPQPGEVAQSSRLLMNPCLAVQWLSAFEELHLPKDLSVFEPCVGASDPVILATEIFSGGRGQYTAVNLNRELASQLRGKLGKIHLKTNIIEENFSRSEPPCPAGSIDVACFHHAINDLLQTAVSEPRGLDTRVIDWWTTERQMITWLGEDAAAGKLDEQARPALMNAVRSAVTMVKPGGYLLFDHWTWVGHKDLDWFPWDLFNNMIPLAREWIHAESLPVDEIPLGGRDPQWWMCLRVR
jgi:hypothetical protein